MPLRMFVSDLIIDARTRSPVVVLKDAAEDLQLPIFIGLMEASAIAAAREKLELPRPMTHDLLKSVLETLGGELQAIEVTRLEESTFHALLHVKRNGKVVTIDSRPSDAIALALRTRSPIFVQERVLDVAGIRKDPPPIKQPGPDEPEDRWAEFLENLDPEDFGKYKQ